MNFECAQIRLLRPFAAALTSAVSQPVVLHHTSCLTPPENRSHYRHLVLGCLISAVMPTDSVPQDFVGGARLLRGTLLVSGVGKEKPRRTGVEILNQ